MLYFAGKGKPGKAGGQQGIGGKTSQGEKEAPVEDNRPWIMKNWMIALPIAFVVIFLECKRDCSSGMQSPCWSMHIKCPLLSF